MVKISTNYFTKLLDCGKMEKWVKQGSHMIKNQRGMCMNIHESTKTDHKEPNDQTGLQKSCMK